MARKRSPAVDYILYLIARVAICIVQSLSWDMARHVAHFLAWLGYTVDKRHRKVALDNLRHAFPTGYSEQQRDQMVRAVFRHFATLIIEILLIPRKLHVHNHRKHIILVNEQELLKLLFSDRPVLILTCHFGNWELAGYYLGLLGFKTHAVARPLDNPHLDKYVRQFRERTGQKILAKHGDFERMTELLASGGVMATLGDQDAGQRGLFVDFFGRPASTHKAVALMALEYNVPIVVSGTYKVGEPMLYKIVTEEVIFPEEYANQPDAVRSMTQRFTRAMERLIRQAPEQYFWLHNRWKHQPVAKPKKKAA